MFNMILCDLTSLMGAVVFFSPRVVNIFLCRQMRPNLTYKLNIKALEMVRINILCFYVVSTIGLWFVGFFEFKGHHEISLPNSRQYLFLTRQSKSLFIVRHLNKKNKSIAR